MAGSPARQLANPDHQQWPPHNAQICPGGAERGIDAATAPNGGYARPDDAAPPAIQIAVVGPDCINMHYR
jgi:hypothetical protein